MKRDHDKVDDEISNMRDAERDDPLRVTAVGIKESCAVRQNNRKESIPTADKPA